jgi:hypothetical protein
MSHLSMISWARPNGIYRKQWHSQVAHPFQYSMQRGLIDHGASQERIPILFQRDRQSLKPVRPLATQMTLDPDLIDHRLVSFAL